MEDYFKKNRAEFDTEEPNRTLIWDGLQAQLLQQRFAKRLRIWKAAAAIAVLLSVASITWSLTRTPATKAPMETAAQENQQTQGSFALVEQSYRDQINTLYTEIETRTTNTEKYAEYYQQINYIDGLEEEFRSDIPSLANKQRLMQVLVDTYEKKIALLERMLSEIDRNEQREKQQLSHETQTIKS